MIGNKAEEKSSFWILLLFVFQKDNTMEMAIHEKYVLSIEEASLYFHIGINRLRSLVNEHKNADWVLWINTHANIKRKKFEQYIDSLSTL